MCMRCFPFADLCSIFLSAVHVLSSSLGFRSYFALFSHCYIRLESFCMHIVVFSWSLGLFVHACMHACFVCLLFAGVSFLFKVFNIPEYSNWRAWVVFTRSSFLQRRVISRPLF